MESILVTGVGGGVGQSIVKSLHGSYRVIGADGENLGTGLFAVDHGYRVPYANQAGFVDRLLKIAEAEKCSLIFPGLDAELPIFSRSAERFKAIGVQVVVSGPDVVGVADDKLATARFLVSHGYPSPVTELLSDCTDDRMVPFPVVLKPRLGGARSQGVYVAKHMADLEMRRESLQQNNYVVQEQIVGDEFTCGSINFGGRCYGAIVMRRVLRDGDTYKAFVVKDEKLTGFVVEVMEKLRPFGACNIQFRLRDGIPYIFEFNARCSGTTYCRTLAGFNEPLMVANYLLRGEEPRYDIREISILRYWKELVVENSRIEQLKISGEISGAGSNL